MSIAPQQAQHMLQAVTESFNASFSSHSDATVFSIVFDAVIYRQHTCSAHEGLSTLPSNCAGSVRYVHASSSLELTQNIHPTVISICLCRCECCMHLTVLSWVAASRNRSATKKGWRMLDKTDAYSRYCCSATAICCATSKLLLPGDES